MYELYNYILYNYYCVIFLKVEYSLILCDDDKRKSSLYVKNTTELLEILKKPSVDDPE